MRAKSVFEKFSDKSNPIVDMGIGGVNINQIYDKIKREAAEKFIKIMIDTLEGKTIRVTAMRWGGRHDWNEYTIKVVKVLNTYKKDDFSHEIVVQDENGYTYTLLGDKKLDIINEGRDQNFRTPFASHSAMRNNQFNASYPLNKLQYEDADKPDMFDDFDNIPCKVCNTPTNPKEFVAGGVCKKCEKQGYWLDNFGRIHHQNSRVHTRNQSYT